MVGRRTWRRRRENYYKLRARVHTYTHVAWVRVITRNVYSEGPARFFFFISSSFHLAAVVVIVVVVVTYIFCFLVFSSCFSSSPPCRRCRKCARGRNDYFLSLSLGQEEVEVELSSRRNCCSSLRKEKKRRRRRKKELRILLRASTSLLCICAGGGVW